MPHNHKEEKRETTPPLDLSSIPEADPIPFSSPDDETTDDDDTLSLPKKPVAPATTDDDLLNLPFTVRKADAEIVTSVDDHISLTELTAAEIEERLTKLAEQLGEVEFRNQLLTSGSQTNVLLISLINKNEEDFAGAKGSDTWGKAFLGLLSKAGVKLEPSLVDPSGETTGKLRGGMYPSTTDTTKLAEIKDPVLRFVHSEKRSRSIMYAPLYGSGTALDLRKPGLSELTDCCNSARFDMTEYGRRYGGLSYAYSDYYLKYAFYQLLLKIVADSKIEKWRSEGSLATAIKLSDIGSLAMYVAKLLYPDGCDSFIHTCPKCGKTTTPEVDLLRLIKPISNRVSAEAFRFILDQTINNKVVTPENLETYQSYLGLAGKGFASDGVKFTFKNASLADYILSGNAYFARINTILESDATESLEDTVRPRLYQQYVPYIEKIESLDDEDNVILTLSDPAEIIGYLDIAQTRLWWNDFVRGVEAYIDSTLITVTAYETPSCSCGYTPSPENKYTFVDPIPTFFTLSYRK